MNERLKGDVAARWKQLFPLLRTMFHEYTHFLDMTTTTYGLSVLNAIFIGASGYSKGKNSASYDGADSARRALSELNMDEMHARISGQCGQPWGYKDWFECIGSEEEEIAHILTGTIFLNPVKKTEFARAPYSIPSLLESNAVSNELFL
ncbi:hypothetical protein F2P45_21055 [Massilia sp. CCM 8733]|uniref:Uncharacterized protein n=1 Tax=Massilia mucilaginosa TaxID=2609282 RepID=A0ABX0NXQ5_9BURK|nr:hypothetical protein [Massilia mucilaginosa]NHZ91475.1 hypothetical protein [Massilia mucilaginosa]